jgi:hypothetical protein
LAIDLEALRFLLSLKPTHRVKLLQWLDKLQNEPFRSGQLTVADAVGRDIQVSVVSIFLVYHWTDHAVKTVQVVRIETNTIAG